MIWAGGLGGRARDIMNKARIEKQVGLEGIGGTDQLPAKFILLLQTLALLVLVAMQFDKGVPHGQRVYSSRIR